MVWPVSSFGGCTETEDVVDAGRLRPDALAALRAAGSSFRLPERVPTPAAAGPRAGADVRGPFRAAGFIPELETAPILGAGIADGSVEAVDAAAEPVGMEEDARAPFLEAGSAPEVATAPALAGAAASATEAAGAIDEVARTPFLAAGSALLLAIAPTPDPCEGGAATDEAEDVVIDPLAPLLDA